MPPFASEEHPPRRITIVGGGFSGVSAAVQLVRRSPVPLAITIVEARERVGPGLAYGTHDPDHRLNGPTWIHSVDPLDGEDFTRWCERHGVFEADPKAVQLSGAAFVRRGVLGRYLEDSVRAHARWAVNGSTIQTLHDRATGAGQVGNTIETTTEGGHTLVSELLLVATGNAEPRLQAPLDPTLARHPAVIENPLNTARLLAIPREARVLVIGSGLTSMDVVSTLRRQRHGGQIVVVSRRGLRSRPQPAATGPVEAPAGAQNLERLHAPPPVFLAEAEPNLRAWVRALREQVRQAQARGEGWNLPFDDLRDSVWQLWPTLPLAQQRRFLRQLRPWYDVHRFRSPPQTEAICRAAEADGQLVYLAARLRAITPAAGPNPLQVTLRPARQSQDRVEPFDVIVNCTGLDVASRTAANPLLHALAQQGWLQPDGCRVGYAVDERHRLIGTDGSVHERVRLIGPPTLGTFGDPGGAMFIAGQIHRLVPDLLRVLGVVPAASPQVQGSEDTAALPV